MNQNITNIEIKARCLDLDVLRKILREKHADFKGVDHQIDTYFKVPNGRLKLREGNIENHLIFYDRKEAKGLKESSILLYDSKPGSSLKEILVRSLGVLAVVDKRREIYFIGNIKFHLDQVEGLGTFAEIEAIDEDGSIGRKKLAEQCDRYMKFFRIRKEDLIAASYSDMLLRRNSGKSA